jgi:hypothetical protein
MTPDGVSTEIDGLGPGVSSSLLVRHADHQAQVALTNRAVHIEPANKRMLHAMLRTGLPAAGWLVHGSSGGVTALAVSHATTHAQDFSISAMMRIPSWPWVTTRPFGHARMLPATDITTGCIR